MPNKGFSRKRGVDSTIRLVAYSETVPWFSR